MNYNFLDKLFTILLVFIFSLISFLIGKNYFKENNEVIKIVRDTLCIVDTITIEKPIEKIRYKEKLVYIPLTDTNTQVIHDTTFVVLQEEKVIYEDSTYKAIISGINPKLEEIFIYPKTYYITEKEEKIIKKKWNFNISMGPGIFYNGKANYGIGCIVGVGYSF